MQAMSTGETHLAYLWNDFQASDMRNKPNFNLLSIEDVTWLIYS